jgi:hypothetical protein
MESYSMTVFAQHDPGSCSFIPFYCQVVCHWMGELLFMTQLLGHFHFGAVTDRVMVNSGVSRWTRVSMSRREMTGCNCWVHGKLRFTEWETANLFPSMAAPSHKQGWASSSSLPPQYLVLLDLQCQPLWGDGASPHYHVTFPANSWCWAPLQLLSCHPYIHSGEMSVLKFCPSSTWIFVFLLMSLTFLCWTWDLQVFSTDLCLSCSSTYIFYRSKVYNFGGVCVIGFKMDCSSGIHI